MAPPSNLGDLSSAGLTRASSAPPAMRASSVVRHGSSGSNAIGGGVGKLGAAQFSPPLSTVGELMHSPVSDVSDSHSATGGKWEGSGKSAIAAAAIAAAGVAAMEDGEEGKGRASF